MKELEAIRDLAQKWPHESDVKVGPNEECQPVGWCAEHKGRYAIQCRRCELAALLPALVQRIEALKTDNLVSCARCNEMKECLPIETGFAGEHEPLCARCLSKERIDAINDNAEEVATLRAEIAALRETMACTHPKACWKERDSKLSKGPMGTEYREGYCTACEHERLAVAAALREAALSLCFYCQRGVPMLDKDHHDNSKNTSPASSECFIHPFCEATRVQIPDSDCQALDAHDAEVFEEAARIADEYLLRNPKWNSYHQDAQLEIAAAIRALKREKKLAKQKEILRDGRNWLTLDEVQEKVDRAVLAEWEEIYNQYDLHSFSAFIMWFKDRLAANRDKAKT